MRPKLSGDRTQIISARQKVHKSLCLVKYYSKTYQTAGDRSLPQPAMLV